MESALIFYPTKKVLSDSNKIFWILFIAIILFFVAWGITYFCNNNTTSDPYDIFVQSVDPSREYIDAQRNHFDTQNTGKNAQHLSDQSYWWEFGGFVIYILGSAVISGLLITIIVNSFERRKERWIKGDVHYNIKSNFIIIIGGHEMVPILCRQILNKPSPPNFIVIQTRRIAEKLRKEIYSIIDSNDHDRIIIYNGERTSQQDLQRLNLAHASEIYIIGENNLLDQEDHDTKNLRCFTIAETLTLGYRKDNPPLIPCHVMFEYQSTFAAFQYTDLSIHKDSILDFIPFNFHEIWAQQVFVNRKIKCSDGHTIEYKPLYDPTNIEKKVHLIIIGMSKMGIAMALEAAHICHFPQTIDNPNHLTRITFIDTNAYQEMQYFKGRYKAMFDLARWRFSTHLNACKDANWHNPLKDTDSNSPYKGDYLGNKFINIEWEFIKGEISHPSIQEYLTLVSANKETATTIAICNSSTPQATSAAMYLPDNVYINAHQILVQQTTDDIIIRCIEAGVATGIDSKYACVRPFGMTQDCDYFSNCNLFCAKLVNYAYNYGEIDPYFTFASDAKIEYLWRNDKVSSGKSVMAKRWSNIYHANTASLKEEVFKIDKTIKKLDNTTIERLAIVEHNRWNIEQLLLGFRPVTPEEEKGLLSGSINRKTLKTRMIHPDIRHFDKLSEGSKFYDRLLGRLLPLILLKKNEYENN